jgi:Septum formation
MSATGFTAPVTGAAKNGRQYRRGLVISALSAAVGVMAACGAANGDVLVTGTVQSSPLLRVGECFSETPQSAGPGAEVGDGINDPVACDQPHSDEVFAILSLTRFTTNKADYDELTKRCIAELRTYSPSASRDPNVQVVMLTPDTSWKYMGNHTSGCLAHFAPNRVGSIKG